METPRVLSIFPVTARDLAHMETLMARSVGRDIEIKCGDRALERGGTLPGDIIRARVYGPESGPTVIVLGGISATRFVCDRGRHDRGWWSPMVHDGGAVDTSRLCVIGCDFAPGEYVPGGNTAITTADQARRLSDLLDHMKIEAVDAIIGSSYGGMTALAFARDYPERVKDLCVIGAAHKPHPIGVGWRGIQRRVVELGIEGNNPVGGLKLARELAMTTYRTPEEFADRFALNETARQPSRFDICDYLGSRGDAFAAHMEAERFLMLSESIDLHKIEPEQISTPTLLMSAISDQLAPLPDMRELRDRLSGPSELFTFTSLYGHDAFLKEYDMIGPRLSEFCEELTA